LLIPTPVSEGVVSRCAATPSRIRSTPKASAGNTAQLWADTKTYQVVRAVSTIKLSAASVIHETDNYTWLPRSASLLKRMTTPVIPAGFKRLAQLP
jgi:hypothetical protein